MYEYESSAVLERLHVAAVHVRDLLSDVESRAANLDSKTDYIRSLMASTGQLSDVIGRLMRLDQRLAWFVWRSLANLVQDLMMHCLTARDVTADCGSGAESSRATDESRRWLSASVGLGDDEHRDDIDYHRWHAARQRNVPQTAADRLLNRLPLLAVFIGWSPPSSSSPPADTTDDNDSGGWYPSPVERQDIRDVMRRCIVDTDLLLTMNFAVGIELNRRLRKKRSIFMRSGLPEEIELFQGESFEPLDKDQYEHGSRENKLTSALSGTAPGSSGSNAAVRQRNANDNPYTNDSHETRYGINTSHSPSVMTEESADKLTTTMTTTPTTTTRGCSDRSHQITRCDVDNFAQAERSFRRQREEIPGHVSTASYTADLVVCCEPEITIKERPTIFDTSTGVSSVVVDEPSYYCGNQMCGNSHGDKASLITGTGDRIGENNGVHIADNVVTVGRCTDQHSGVGDVTKCRSKPSKSSESSAVPNQLQSKLDDVRTAILSGDDLMLTARGPPPPPPHPVGVRQCPVVPGVGERRARDTRPTTGPAISTLSLRTTCGARLPTAQCMPHFHQCHVTNTLMSRDRTATSGYDLNPSSASKFDTFEHLGTYSTPTSSSSSATSAACAEPCQLTDRRLAMSTMSKTVQQLAPPCDERNSSSQSLSSSGERRQSAQTSKLSTAGRVLTHCRRLPDGRCGCTSVTEDGRLSVEHFEHFSAVKIATSDDRLFQSSSSERTYQQQQQQSLRVHLQPSAQHHHGVSNCGSSGPIRLNRHRYVDRFKSIKHVVS